MKSVPQAAQAVNVPTSNQHLTQEHVTASRSARMLAFGPFTLEIGSAELRMHDTSIKLRHKAWEVLHYLASHPNRLINKEELMENVWRGGHVTAVALRVCIREIRVALGDSADHQRYISSHGQRGYRFTAAVATLDTAAAAPPQRTPDPLLVGRGVELKRLDDCWTEALAGARQVVFATGEPGRGKTTLLNAFVAQATSRREVWWGLGQCVQQYGGGEPYRPVLEALSRLCRHDDGGQFRDLLRQHAPSWLVQIPASRDAHEPPPNRPDPPSADKECMLRELAEALDAVTAVRPLLLVLEDLQWSDHSTIELLSVLARRCEPARMMVLGSCRPPDIAAGEEVLRSATQELALHDHCCEISLSALTQDTVGEYLALRFPGIEPVTQLAALVHGRTEGNPLFMVNTADALVDHGLVCDTGSGWRTTSDASGREAFARSIPHSLRRMIEVQLSRLDEREQALLRIASVVGVEFDTAALAAGLSASLDAIEEQCESLGETLVVHLGRRPVRVARRHIDVPLPLRPRAVPERVLPAACGRATGATALAGRQLPGGRLRIAGERDRRGSGDPLRPRRATLRRPCITFTRRARMRCAATRSRKPLLDLERGIALLHRLPPSTARDQQELELTLTLGPALMMSKGYSAAVVKRTYERARELCDAPTDAPQQFQVHMGLWSHYLVRGDLETARHLATRLSAIAQASNEVSLRLPAHYAMATTLSPLGDVVECGRAAEAGCALYEPAEHHDLSLRYAIDPGVMCLGQRVLSLWRAGYSDQARARGAELLGMVRSLGHTLSLVHTLGVLSICERFNHEVATVRDQAEEMIALSEAATLPFWLAAGRLLRGWAMVQQGEHDTGIAEVQRALVDSAATGAGIYRSYYLGTLAEVYGLAGQLDDGLQCVDEGLAYLDASGERVHESELHRLKGWLLMQRATGADVMHEAEQCFVRARDAARRQSARNFELRATLALSRLWHQQGRQEQARDTLRELHNWFVEGLDTGDMRAAERLLAEL